jgi:ABC-type Fe3+/spermidine/putrescine transport system ATPase subunit
MTAAGLAVERAGLSLGVFSLRDVSFSVAAGEVLVLLGPNGAGKSVCLELIAGFHRAATGRVRIAGRDVTALPPERRRIGFVVQNYGLFPHLTVAGNVAYGLRARGEAGQVAPLLERFGVAALARRLPHDLSPGEKQRVALARALASRPHLFLFDEPFAALDGQTRDGLRDELRAFLRESRIPAVVVSHHQTDAHLLADHVAILYDGALQQVGPVAEVFARPANRYVAECTGVENILTGAAAVRLSPGGAGATLCVRAEHVEVLPACALPADALRLDAVVRDIAPLGAVTRVTLDCGFPLIAALAYRDAAALTPGRRVVACIARPHLHVLHGAGQLPGRSAIRLAPAETQG